MDRPSKSDSHTAVIFAGGEAINVEASPPLPPGALLIAADGGLAQAQALGLDVDVVVGDMDSVDTAALAAAKGRGATVERHATDKDATDLELALDHAATAGCSRVVVVGGLGGRIDHLLANALLLAAASELTVEWRADTARVLTVRPDRPLESSAAVGDLVSLLPVGGAASGVRTEGLRWRLAGDALQPGSTRGVSNEATATRFSVSLDGGALIVVHQPKEAR